MAKRKRCGKCSRLGHNRVTCKVTGVGRKPKAKRKADKRKKAGKKRGPKRKAGRRKGKKVARRSAPRRHKWAKDPYGLLTGAMRANPKRKGKRKGKKARKVSLRGLGRFRMPRLPMSWRYPY